MDLESNGDGFSGRVSPTWLDTTSWQPGCNSGTTQNAIVPRGLSGMRPKSPALMRRPCSLEERAVLSTLSLEAPFVTCKPLALPTLTPIVSRSPATRQDLESETQQRQHKQQLQQQPEQRRDNTEGASLEITMCQSSGNSPLAAAINSTRTLAIKQTDGQRMTALVGDASARPGQTISVSVVDAAVKTESDGHLDIHRWSASLLTHHSKTPPAEDTLTRPVPTCSSVEGIVDERRRVYNQANEDGPMPYLEYLESLNTPVNKWFDRVRRPAELNIPAELNVDFVVPHRRLESSLGTTGSAKAESPSPSPAPVPEGPVRYRSTSSGGVASSQSKKPLGSPSPNWLRKVLGTDDANQKTRCPTLEMSLDFFPAWNRMATPLEHAASGTDDLSPRVPERPKSPKSARRLGRMQFGGIMASHEKAQMRTR